jgi:hypothetical protein
MKKFEVCIKEINHGYIIVSAENARKATRIALQKYHREMAVMGDEPDIETETVREILPMGFR